MIREYLKSYESSLSLSFLSSKKILGFFFCSFLLSLDFKFWFLLIEFHELGEIELGFLEKLNLSNKDVLEWEDLTAFLDYLLADSILNAKGYN